MAPRRNLVPPLQSAPSPPSKDDFEEEAEQSLNDQMSSAKALKHIRAITNATSETARFAPAINSLRNPHMTFDAEPSDPLPLETLRKLFPGAFPLAQSAPLLDARVSSDSVVIDLEVDKEEERMDVDTSDEEDNDNAEGEGSGLDVDDDDLSDDEEEMELKVDERESDEERAKWSKDDREMAVLKDQLTAAGTPIPGPMIVYVSPFEAAIAEAEANTDSELAWRLRLALKRDLTLNDYLRDIALNIPVGMLDELMASFKIAVRKFGKLPSFRVNSANTKITLIFPARIISLNPCIFLAATITANGQTVHNLAALIAYTFVSEGQMRDMFRSAVARPSKMFVYADIFGTSAAERPPSAASIKNAGLYGINPMGVYCIFGMTFSLGLDRRSSEYAKTSYALQSKMGVMQQYVTQVGSTWPGERVAIMWHDTRVPLSALPIPAGALYGAESLLIVMTGSTLSVAEDIKQSLIDSPPPPPFQVPIAEHQQPIVGLNTNIGDSKGAFTSQAAMGISMAKDFVRVLVAQNKAEVPLPEYSAKADDSAQVSAFYRNLFVGILPPDLSMTSIYRFVRLRTLVVRRAFSDLKGEMGVFYHELLPGRNPMGWVRAKILRVPGKGISWE